MTIGDVLYGVTMETPGVSKKVKVDLRGDGNLDLVRKAAGRNGGGNGAPQEADSPSATALMDGPDGDDS